MFDRLEEILKRYDFLSEKISDPEVINNQVEWQKMMKEYRDRKSVV